MISPSNKYVKVCVHDLMISKKKRGMDDKTYLVGWKVR